MSALHPDWLVPDWPAPRRVRSVFTTRAGGVSASPFDAMNLGDHVDDAPASVAANRQALARAIGATPIFLRQVHGREVAVWSTADDALAPTTEADACLTAQPGLACTIMVADCLPVLFTDRQGTAVAAAHAGWRGLAGSSGSAGSAAQGVLETTQEALVRRTGSSTADLLAWLGPCIGPTAFEVGDEVRDVFVAMQAEAEGCFRPQPVVGRERSGQPRKWLADLPALARLRLRAAGLGDGQIYGNDSSAAWCTVGQASRFFSYRRDRATGRMAACIWLD